VPFRVFPEGFAVTEIELFDRFALVSAVASGAVAFGVGQLLFAPRTWVGRAVNATAALGVMSGLAAVLCPAVLAWVAGGGAAVLVVGVLLGSATARRLVERCLQAVCRPRVVGTAAVLAAGGWWGYEAWRFDRGHDALMDTTLLQVRDMSTPPTAATDTARTDCGTAIELDAAVAPLSTSELTELERNSQAVRDRAGKFIRRGAPADEANCHGWVFTGGRYNLRGRFVEVILSDNGYTDVDTPAAGDLCVYRDPQGEVSHTGVVQAVLGDGSVLVESKWGRLGVYLHAAGDSCYGTNFTFHHTDRSTHRLRGFEPDSGTAATTSHP
jgi:hypothetical protein